MLDKIRKAKQKNSEFDEFMKELKGKQEGEDQEIEYKEVKPQNVLNSLDIAKKIALDLNL